MHVEYTIQMFSMKWLVFKVFKVQYPMQCNLVDLLYILAAVVWQGFEVVEWLSNQQISSKYYQTLNIIISWSGIKRKSNKNTARKDYITSLMA